MCNRQLALHRARLRGALPLGNHQIKTSLQAGRQVSNGREELDVFRALRPEAGWSAGAARGVLATQLIPPDPPLFRDAARGDRVRRAADGERAVEADPSRGTADQQECRDGVDAPPEWRIWIDAALQFGGNRPLPV